MPNTTAIIVEDDFLIAASYSMVCEDLGIRVIETCDTAAGAIEAIIAHQPTLAFLDVRLRGKGDGIDVANAIRDHGLNTKIIFVTGSQEPETIRRMNAVKPAEILSKPIPPEHLEQAILD